MWTEKVLHHDKMCYLRAPVGPPSSPRLMPLVSTPLVRVVTVARSKTLVRKPLAVGHGDDRIVSEGVDLNSMPG